MATSYRAAAFFDIDRTLVVNTSMEKVLLPYLIRRRFLRAPDLARYLARAAVQWSNNGEAKAMHNKAHLQHKDPAELRRLAADCFHRQIRPLISHTGRQRVASHREQGHLVVLLTGSLQPLAELLRREVEADLVLAACLEITDGTLSGRLSNARPYGGEKARLVRQLAQDQGIDLSNSYAYGDHRTDYEVLSAVGNPVAVNPDPWLRIKALSRGWPIEQF